MSQGLHFEESLKRASCEGILSFWAGEIGMNVPELIREQTGAKLSVNMEMPGIMVFRRGTDVRIAASASKIERIGKGLGNATLDAFCTAEFWRTSFPEYAGAIIGPALYYYIDAVPKTWSPPPTSRSLLLVRGLAASDMKVCAGLSAALTREEREASGFDTLGRQVWGVFAKGELVAMAGYDAWPNRVAHLGVATHPEHRGCKFAQLAVQAAIRGAAMRRRIAQYRCLSSDPAAVGVARALGVRCFAESLFISQPTK
jgi:RimJ/RimL family protein N-acetyltransferase